MVKQLAKLVDVVHADRPHRRPDSYEVEIALIKLECEIWTRARRSSRSPSTTRRAWSTSPPDSLILQAHGSSEKLDALTELLRPFGVVELVRSGKLLMARGKSRT